MPDMNLDSGVPCATIIVCDPPGSIKTRTVRSSVRSLLLSARTGQTGASQIGTRTFLQVLKLGAHKRLDFKKKKKEEIRLLSAL